MAYYHSISRITASLFKTFPPGMNKPVTPITYIAAAVLIIATAYASVLLTAARNGHTPIAWRWNSSIITHKLQNIADAACLPVSNPPSSLPTPPRSCIFSPEDDLFRKNGDMKVKGRSISCSEAEEICEQSLLASRLSLQQLHRAQLFHGANSSSLIAFTPYNDCRGELTPTGILEKEGRVPFSGEIIFGRSGGNREYLSTVWIKEFEVATGYANADRKWSPNKGKAETAFALTQLTQDIEEAQRIEKIDISLRESLRDDFNHAKETMDFSSFHDRLYEFISKLREAFKSGAAGTFMLLNLNTIEINQKRLVEWTKLNELEQQLILNPFPVVYGIRSDRKKAHFPALGSDIPGEILLFQGARPQEIKVIFTPPQKVAFVRQLLDAHGHSDIAVEALPRS